MDFSAMDAVILPWTLLRLTIGFIATLDRIACDKAMQPKKAVINLMTEYTLG